MKISWKSSTTRLITKIEPVSPLSSLLCKAAKPSEGAGGLNNGIIVLYEEIVNLPVARVRIEHTGEEV